MLRRRLMLELRSRFFWYFLCWERRVKGVIALLVIRPVSKAVRGRIVRGVSYVG
jgi:hypothetical protein